MSPSTEFASLKLLAKRRTAAAAAPDHEEEVYSGKGELSNPGLVLPSQRREELDQVVGTVMAREFVRIKPTKRRRVSGEHAVSRPCQHHMRLLMDHFTRQDDLFSLVSSWATPPRRRPGSTSSSVFSTPDRAYVGPGPRHEELDDFWSRLLHADADDPPSSPAAPWANRSKKRRTSDVPDLSVSV